MRVGLESGLPGSTCQGMQIDDCLFRRGASLPCLQRFVFWPFTPTPMMSSFSARAHLALLREAGSEVTIATMTPGDCGSAEHDCATIAEIRRGEARAAAALIGADYLCLEFRDLAIFNDDDSRRRVVEALRRTRPDLILTAPPVDYHCDHEMTSRLVRDACFGASCPNYATRQWDPAPPLARDSASLLMSIPSKALTPRVGPWRSTSTSM